MKRIMAYSGLFFLFFVLFHAYGNLKYFEGEDVYDGYAAHLRTMFMPILPREGLLWILRAIMVACLVGHAGAAFHLWHRNNKARGNQKYAVKKAHAEYAASRYANRTMRWGGVILILFIVWHILQFTTLNATPGGHYVHGDAYKNMYLGFHDAPWTYAIYFIALAALALHAWHGVWSALQTLGAIRGSVIPGVRIIATLVALALFVAFMAVPTAILFGWVDAPAAGSWTALHGAVAGH